MSFHTTIARLREASRAASLAGEDPNTCRVGRQDLRTALHLVDRLDADLRQAGMLSQCAPVAALQWSEVTEPNEQIRYTHVLAASPLGRFSIEWKSWKPHDSCCAYLDGDYLDTSMGLDDAKAIALKKVADMAHALAGFAAPEASAPVAREAVAALIRERRYLGKGVNGKHFYSEFSEWFPATVSQAKAVTSPGRDPHQTWDVRWLVDAAPQASEAVRDVAFEAARKQLCKLPRYSFFAGAALGSVRRAEDSSGNWIEFDAAHALFDPVSVDAALSAQPGAQKGKSDE